MRPFPRLGRRIAISTLAILATVLAGPVGGQVITESSIPAGSAPFGIVAGPDGNIWFTELNGNRIGRISMRSVVTEFPIPTSTSTVEEITAGPDGNLWFTELDANQIGRITPDGVITEFPVPRLDSAPRGITAGPDGNVWFTENDASQVGRITPAGVITEFPIPTAGSSPLGIAVGADGNLWFAEGSGNQIGRITPTGVITEFPLPTADSWPVGIAAGPDGNLWFTDFDAGLIGRITTAGVITEFSIPTANSLPAGIAAGPDGNLWFTEFDANKIGRITPEGVITEFPVPTPDGGPAFISAGPDGSLWFAEANANKIGRITTGSCVSTGTALCLSDGRFRIGMTWSVPAQGRSGVGSAVPLTGDTGYFWFFNEANIELVVKALDGRGVNGHYWVFYGALSNVQYTITVTDTVTGAVKSYENPSGTLASVADTSAFTETSAGLDAAAAASTEDVASRSAEELYGLYEVLTESFVPKVAAAACTPGDTTLCLNQSRFEVTVDWEVPSQGRSGHGAAVSVTGDTGYFWFFDDANIELVVKALDGRPVNGHFWVFYGALSNVQYTITVTDTETGAVRSYENRSGTLASVADTAAF